MGRVIVLGATGMLGHQVCNSLGRKFEVYGTVSKNRCIAEPDASIVKNFFMDSIQTKPIHFEVGDGLDNLLDLTPDCIINCIGAIPQNNPTPEQMSEVNGVFPIQLAQMAEANNIRLILVSTDCVFSGAKGFYSELDKPDASTTYGKTKAFGEVSNLKNVLTIRTSFYGKELFNKTSLFEWFLQQEGGTIKGYKNFIFSGMPSPVLAMIIDYLVDNDLHGLYHVGFHPYSKYRLLEEIKNRFNLNIEIEPEYTTRYNKSLNCEKLSKDWRYWQYIEALILENAVRTLSK